MSDTIFLLLYIHFLTHQIEPTEANQHRGGFRGGTFMGAPYISHLLDPAQASSTSAAQQQPHIPADCAHLVMTYTALASLAILQVPDLPSKLHREAIVASVRAAQQPNGSFASTELGSECDLRFTYAACCVSHMLGDWNGVDIPRAAAYIKASLSYEGAFGQGPGLEAHGGSTFCAVASLKLMVGGGGLGGDEFLIVMNCCLIHSSRLSPRTNSTRCCRRRNSGHCCTG